MPTELPFSENRLRNLESPAKGRIYYRDSKTPGLQVQVTDKGTRTYYFRRRTLSGQQRIRIGRVGEISLAQARGRAAELAGEVARGGNPQAELRRQRHAPTLQNAYAHWMDAHAKPHKRSWRGDQWQYERFLASWGKRRLASITKADVQTLHARIGRESGRYQANRVLALLSSMFNKAGEIGYQEGNPCQGVQKFREETRDRFLQADELRVFFQALAEEPNQDMRDLFLLALLTGARKGNVCAMQWGDLNLVNAYWRIPETKGGKPVVVPLVEPAVKLLEARRERVDGSPWVFPSRGKTGHLVEPKSAWKRIIRRAGLEGVRIHDLRRTLGSWQALSGASLQVIGASLGHRDMSATEVYSRLTLDPVRESVSTATARILEAGGLLEHQGAPQAVDVRAEDSGATFSPRRRSHGLPARRGG